MGGGEEKINALCILSLNMINDKVSMINDKVIMINNKVSLWEVPKKRSLLSASSLVLPTLRFLLSKSFVFLLSFKKT
jgi:hypothetical protein